MHFVVTCEEQASFAVAKFVKYIKVGATSVAIALEVEGSNILTCTSDIPKLLSQQYCNCYLSTLYIHTVTYGCYA